MLENHYKEAQKLGQRESRACAARGEYPYLPVLDSFVPEEKLSTAKEVGMMQLPAELIVGTRTGSRANSFARNFMPLSPETSEFALKWRALCDAHLAEGIRDPVKVYEYLNRYYVQEGNKRVSVLKYFGAVTIAAQVYRVLPERTEDKEVVLYYKQLEFRQASDIHFLEFSKPGSYEEFARLMGKQLTDRWSEDEQKAFNTVFYYFRKACEGRGKALPGTVSDALLAYIRVYGYKSLHGKTAPEIRRLVEKVWEEIAVQQQEVPIAVKLNPEQKKTSLIDKVIATVDLKPTKVAFIHDKIPETSGWTNSHEQGRKLAETALNGQVVTSAWYTVPGADPAMLLRQAIEQGNKIIFTTSPVLLPASLRVAVENPDVTIFNCSINQPHRYIRTYYARMYEAKFVAGAIAGSLAGGNPVGYLCDYPISGQIAGINAFALGVAMTNPRAKVYLEWSGVDSVDAATKRLTDRGITLISSQDMARLDSGCKTAVGLSLITGEDSVQLASPVWNWGVYYEALIRQILDKTSKVEYQESSKALNYFWGMSAGVVELNCTEKLPDGTRQLAKILQNSIRSGAFKPFHGPIYAQGGRKAGEAHSSLTQEQIINMDWLVENVVGTIPKQQELTETGKATAKFVGVEKPVKNGIEEQNQ